MATDPLVDMATSSSMVAGGVRLGRAALPLLSAGGEGRVAATAMAAAAAASTATATPTTVVTRALASSPDRFGEQQQRASTTLGATLIGLRRSPFSFSARLYSTDAARPGDEEREGEDGGKQQGTAGGEGASAEGNDGSDDNDTLRADLLRASMNHVVSSLTRSLTHSLPFFAVVTPPLPTRKKN